MSKAVYIKAMGPPPDWPSQAAICDNDMPAGTCGVGRECESVTEQPCAAAAASPSAREPLGKRIGGAMPVSHCAELGSGTCAVAGAESVQGRVLHMHCVACDAACCNTNIESTHLHVLARYKAARPVLVQTQRLLIAQIMLTSDGALFTMRTRANSSRLTRALITLQFLHRPEQRNCT